VTDRTYRTLLGVVLLVCLYFDFNWLIYAMILVLLVEGLSNKRVPMLVCSIRNCASKGSFDYVDAELVSESRFNIESEQVWRLVVAFFLIISYSIVDALWFYPWFMGFAIFGAGFSGVCPVLLAIRWAGFK